MLTMHLCKNRLIFVVCSYRTDSKTNEAENAGNQVEYSPNDNVTKLLKKEQEWL